MNSDQPAHRLQPYHAHMRLALKVSCSACTIKKERALLNPKLQPVLACSQTPATPLGLAGNMPEVFVPTWNLTLAYCVRYLPARLQAPCWTQAWFGTRLRTRPPCERQWPPPPRVAAVA